MSDLANMVEGRRRVFLRLARRYAPLSVDPEDCLQDAIMLALKRSDQFRGEAQLATWFSRIVINCALGGFRKAVNREHVPLEKVASILSLAYDSPERRAQQTQMMSVLAGLPAKYREPLRWAYIDGVSQTQIAARLGCPLGTVKARLFHGKRYLRKRLSGQFDPKEATQ